MSAAIVLMYHRLGEGILPDRAIGEALYAIRHDTFEEQLEIVSQSGRSVVSLQAIASGLGDRVGERPVCFTFDDGNRSDLEHATPSLLRRKFPATFFVTPSMVGQTGYLGWEEVRELARSGMEVGAHGFEHVELSSLGESEMRWQLRESRRCIEARAGVVPRFMSLPGGAGGAREVNAARAEGFSLIAGSLPATVRQRKPVGLVPRFAVRNGDSRRSFEALLGAWPGERMRRLARHRASTALRTGLGERLYQAARGAWERRASSG